MDGSVAARGPLPRRPAERLGLALLCGLLFALPLEAEPLPVAPGPADGEYPGFEVRYGMAASALSGDLSTLVEKPTLIASLVTSFVDEGTKGKIVEAMGESQAVYDIPLDALASILEVSDEQAGYGAGILDARVELKTATRAIVYQELGSSFLGIRMSYKTVSEVFRDELAGGAIGFRARLIESVDSKLYESFSSWYLLPVILNGKTYVYIRTYMRSGIRNPFLGAESIMKAFIPRQSSDMIASNVREVRKRLKAK